MLQLEETKSAINEAAAACAEELQAVKGEISTYEHRLTALDDDFARYGPALCLTVVSHEQN